MRLAVDLTKVQAKPALPVGLYDIRVVTEPVTKMEDGQEVLIVSVEAQVRADEVGSFATVLDYPIRKDPRDGWNTEAMEQVIVALGIPLDRQGMDTEEFLGKTGRVFVDHYFAGEGDRPTAFISRFVPLPGGFS
jgi:hypothetical protein